MENKFIRKANGMNINIEISHKRQPGKAITISMDEYRDFIREQSEILGMLERSPEGYDMEITGVKIPEELIQMFMKHGNDNPGCPRCGNEEITEDAKYCEICGLPVIRKENINE